MDTLYIQLRVVYGDLASGDCSEADALLCSQYHVIFSHLPVPALILTHRTLTYPVKAPKVTIRPFTTCHMSLLGGRLTRQITTVLCMGRCLVKCRHVRGQAVVRGPDVPIQPSLLISFLRPIPGCAFLHPSSPRPLKLRRSPVRVAPSSKVQLGYPQCLSDVVRRASCIMSYILLSSSI